MYTPSRASSLTTVEELQGYLANELLKISQEGAETTALDLRPIFALPLRPREGMIIYADGTSYNPGSGEGPYVYKNGVWQPFITGDTGRKKLTANTTYSVPTDFATPPLAMDYIANSLDKAGYDVTVNVANATYTGTLAIKPWVGGGAVSFIGNTTTPSSCVISTTSANAIEHLLGALPGKLTIKGFKLTTATSGFGLFATQPASIEMEKMDFGAVAAGYAHAFVRNGPLLNFIGNYSITGGTGYHYIIGVGSQITTIPSITVTLSGTPAFGTAFAWALNGGAFYGAASVYSGAATGKRYQAELNGVFDTGGGGANFFPGNATGTQTTGGQYN